MQPHRPTAAANSLPPLPAARLALLRSVSRGWRERDHAALRLLQTLLRPSQRHTPDLPCHDCHADAERHPGSQLAREEPGAAVPRAGTLLTGAQITVPWIFYWVLMVLPKGEESQGRPHHE